MSFLTQRFANSYPLGTKIRNDPSSMGQRWWSCFAQELEENQGLAVRVKHEFELLKPWVGLSFLYRVDLDEDDAYDFVGGHQGSYIYPTVSGTIGMTVYPLTRYEDLSDFLHARPDRLTASGTTTYAGGISVWSSTVPTVINQPALSERLYIDITNSTNWYRKTSNKNLKASGFHRVILVGTDENDNRIEEHVHVRGEGVYCTRNIFKTVVEILTEGFDGQVDIKWFPFGLSYLFDPFKTLVLDDLEGELRITHSVSNGHSMLNYGTNRYKEGQFYKNPSTDFNENWEEFGWQGLRSSAGAAITVIDIALNWRTGLLYALAANGVVHIYDHKPTPFKAFRDPETETSYIELSPLLHYERFGQTGKLFTYFRRMRLPISQVRIWRYTPAGVKNFLQADKTWGVGTYAFTGDNSRSVIPEETWVDMSFTNTYSEFGQWEFYIETTTTHDITVYRTAVMIDVMDAVKSINTGIGTPVGIAFLKENLVSILTPTNVQYFTEDLDGWVADTARGQIILRSNFDSITVT